MLEMPVSQLGALLFDRDMRAIESYLAEQAPWGVRDKFVRLRQMAYVLNADDDDPTEPPEGSAQAQPATHHIYEAGLAEGLAWQLSTSEVERVRARLTA